MFRAGFEASRFGALSAKVKRALFGADCYAYALVASGFGADLVVEADLGLYDYCALVPVVEGAGWKMTDWAGQTLSLRNHQLSRGRVVAAGSSDLHAQALKVLGAPDAPAAPKEHVLPIGVVVAAGAAISAGGAALLSKIRYK